MISACVSDRPGGYLRILQTGYRRGDSAPMALVQLTERQAVSTAAEPAVETAPAAEGKTKKVKKAKAAPRKKAAKSKKTAAKAAAE
jgi:large subunit ribosomal protein L17